MLKLKLVEESPGVPQVWFDLHSPQEPLPGLGDFALAPEQPKRAHGIIRANVLTKLGGAGGGVNSDIVLCHREQHVGIMLALLQGVNALRLPLWPGLQEHGLSPQDAWVEQKRQPERQLREPTTTVMVVSKCLIQQKSPL